MNSSTNSNARIKRVVMGFCRRIRNSGIFFCCESTKVNLGSVYSYVRFPNSLTFDLTHANEAGSACFSSRPVLSVFCFCRQPQVTNSVVIPDAVDVVNALRGEHSEHVQPSQPMLRIVKLPIYKNRSVPFVSFRASAKTGASVVGAYGLFNPCKYTSFRIVIKDFAQALCGKIGLSHAVSPVKKWFGQKPQSVSALLGLRHFNRALFGCTA